MYDPIEHKGVEIVNRNPKLAERGESAADPVEKVVELKSAYVDYSIAFDRGFGRETSG